MKNGESFLIGGNYGALFIDLSNAFDTFMDDLVIAKLDAYGFDHISVTYIHLFKWMKNED